MLSVLFSCVLNMTITASAVILVVLAVRLVLRRAPKIFSYALWAVVLFRLLCPVSLSVPLTLPDAVEIPVEAASAYTTQVTYIRPAAQKVETAPPTEAPAAAPEQPPAATEAVEKHRSGDLLPVLWLVGVGGMGLYSALSYLKLRRRLVGATVLERGVYLADHIVSPFVMGLFRPRIYLPSALEQRERGYIILHERHHIRRGDHVVKLLAFLALSLHWFNPLVWVAFILSGKDMEISCDEAVVKALGEDICRDYSASLLHLATGQRIISGTPLAFGEGDTKSRIRNMMSWKRPRTWMVAAGAAVCLLVVCACGVNPAGKTPAEEPPGPADTAPEQVLTGKYSSVESYIAGKLDQLEAVTYYNTDGDQAQGYVQDARIHWLIKRGELEGLAPEGKLEAWTYNYLVQLNVPAEEVMLVGGMYEEQGWLDLEGQGGRNVVALRYPDGSLDILYDHVINDNMSFYGYHLSHEEALYDWYVTEYGLDLPLYVEDLGDANIPAHRFDGDGWYLYIPVPAWEKLDAYGDSWRSAYLTGSELTVYAPDSHSAADCGRYLVGLGFWEYGEDSERYIHVRHKENAVEDFYYDLPGGGSIQVRIQWQPDNLGGQEDEVDTLRHMARSFTVDDRMVRYEPEETPIITTELQMVLYSMELGEGDIVLSLSRLGGDAVWGSYPGWGTSNDEFYSRNLADLQWTQVEGADLEVGAWVVTMHDREKGWSLEFYENSSIMALRNDGVTTFWKTEVHPYNADPWDCARGWYDEAEYRDLSGGYGAALVPDKGQSWLEAAREGALQLQQLHLRTTVGSKFCWTYVNCIVEAADETTESFRQGGEIGEDTWCFYLTTVFLPENHAAWNESMAGNTGDHTGIDPDAPEGALEHHRCCFVTKTSEGWEVSITGTGW